VANLLILLKNALLDNFVLEEGDGGRRQCMLAQNSAEEILHQPYLTGTWISQMYSNARNTTKALVPVV
jgi:hypothetical protein